MSIFLITYFPIYIISFFGCLMFLGLDEATIEDEKYFWVFLFLTPYIALPLLIWRPYRETIITYIPKEVELPKLGTTWFVIINNEVKELYNVDNWYLTSDNEITIRTYSEFKRYTLEVNEVFADKQSAKLYLTEKLLDSIENY